MTTFAAQVRAQALLSHADLSGPEADALRAITADFGLRPATHHGALEGIRVGLLFAKSSTRTRTSFWRAATDLGADTVTFGPDELQTTTGESWHDTGRVLGQYLDAVVVRTNGPVEQMRDLSDGVPAVVNAMSSSEHPTQALADYATVVEHFGEATDVKLAYFGEGNSTAVALALLFSGIEGASCTMHCPPGYGLPEWAINVATSAASRAGAAFSSYDIVPNDPDPVDVVYTSRWETMGVRHGGGDWRDAFRPFSVDQNLFERFSTPGRTVFMHDLPAVRGDEVTEEVLDGPHSIAWRQAYHKRSGAGGALLWALGHRL